jgi:hypothetical protein
VDLLVSSLCFSQIPNLCRYLEDVKRDNTIQFLGLKEPVSFPVVNKVLRHDSKTQKTTFKYKRPSFAAH